MTYIPIHQHSKEKVFELLRKCAVGVGNAAGKDLIVTKNGEPIKTPWDYEIIDNTCTWFISEDNIRYRVDIKFDQTNRQLEVITLPEQTRLPSKLNRATVISKIIESFLRQSLHLNSK